MRHGKHYHTVHSKLSPAGDNLPNYAIQAGANREQSAVDRVHPHEEGVAIIFIRTPLQIASRKIMYFYTRNLNHLIFLS